MKFLACAVLIFFAPTILYCYVIGQNPPLKLLTYEGVLGVLLGVWMFKKRSFYFVSCIPVNHVPDVSSVAHIREMRKVA